MALINKKLTDLTEKINVSDDAFIHVVEPNDLSQSSSGSSFKVKKSVISGTVRAQTTVSGTVRTNANTADPIVYLKGEVDALILNKQNILGFTPENVANKQNSLFEDSSNAKYPTVTAVNNGLNTKANNTDLNAKSDKSNTYTKSEVDNIVTSNQAPRATDAISGTVRTTTAEVNPQVYTVSIADNLLGGKVDKTTTVNGQALSGNVVIATGTVNSTDAQLRDRTTHTGAQPIATVTGLQTALDGKQNAGDFATNTTVTNGLNTKINTSEKGANNGVATLGANGKIPNSQIPALAISETFPVATQAEMLNLTLAEQGDIAIRSDVSRAFILRQTPSSTLGNWSELLTPASTVTSVAGKVGAVVLNSGDVGLGNVPNLSFSGTNTGDNATNAQYSGLVSNATHTGEVTGATALTITNNAVTNAKLAQVPTKTFKGRTTALTGNVEDLTVAQVRTDLSINNLDNTTDLLKPISTATETALNARITGTGTTNQLAKFTASGAVGNSLISDNGTAVAILANTTTITSVNDAVPLRVITNSLPISTIGFKGSTGTNEFNTRLGADVNDLVFYTNNLERARISNIGNVGINQLTPTERLDVVGNGKFSGTVTATSFFQSSDIRLKNIIKRDGDVIYYTWKDKRDTNTHIGYIAQKVRVTNPDQVNKDDKGMLSVNYIEILVEKIRNLEKEIELLKAK